MRDDDWWKFGEGLKGRKSRHALLLLILRNPFLGLEKALKVNILVVYLQKKKLFQNLEFPVKLPL